MLNKKKKAMEERVKTLEWKVQNLQSDLKWYKNHCFDLGEKLTRVMDYLEIKETNQEPIIIVEKE